MSICHVCERVAPHFGQKGDHVLHRCSSCGLLFVSPVPASTQDIYGRDYFEGATGGFGYVDYDGDKEPMIPAFEQYLGLIEAALGGKGSLLDVGAATGFFVELAQNAGFTAAGVELSDHAAARGRARGLDIRTGTLADVSGIHDAISMLDVIEHVSNPRADIRRAASLLRDDGVLAINTPDAGSLLARLMGVRWHLVVPPEHLYYFTRAGLRRLLEQEGFEIVLDTTIGKSFTPAYILKTLQRWTRFKPFNWAASLTNDWPVSVPINLRDNMFVLARKVAA